MTVVALLIERRRRSIKWRARHDKLIIMKSNSVQQTSDQQPPNGTNDTSQEATTADTNPMDLQLYKAAKKGDVDQFISTLEQVSAEKSVTLHTIFDQVSPLLQNTYLHVAASYGNVDLVGFIVHHFRYMLIRTNHKGDTALHVAARAGYLRVVDILLRSINNEMAIIDFPKNSGSIYLRRVSFTGDEDEKINNVIRSLEIADRMINEDGNTPLHEAMINDHDRVVKCLLDSRLHTRRHEVAYYVNNEGKSPLYIAVESGKLELVKTILNLKRDNQDVIDHNLEKGKSLAHAAIMARNQVMLQQIAEMKPALIYSKDEYERNLLHIAASIGFIEGVSYLLNNFSINTYEKDQDGFCPLHTAAKNGHVEVIQELLEHCVDEREFLNGKGQNLLHVAAKHGKDDVVKYVLKTPELGILINERDKDGNTPLHLATLNWHPKVVSSLTWDKRVNLRLLNNESLTTLEVAEEYMESMVPCRKQLVWMALMSAGAPRARQQEEETAKANRQKSARYKTYNKNYYKDRVNTLLLVATLVATVTFAAGFTLPGGYNNSEPHQGMATMLREQKFQVFVICDTIAMYGSLIVAVTLIWAQLGDIDLVLNALRFALPLLGISLTMMSLAFMAGVYLVLTELAWLANVIFTMGIIFLTTLLALFIPLYLPYSSNILVARYVFYYPFCLLMLASGSYKDHDPEE